MTKHTCIVVHSDSLKRLLFAKGMSFFLSAFCCLLAWCCAITQTGCLVETSTFISPVVDEETSELRSKTFSLKIGELETKEGFCVIFRFRLWWRMFEVNLLLCFSGLWGLLCSWSSLQASSSSAAGTSRREVAIKSSEWDDLTCFDEKKLSLIYDHVICSFNSTVLLG